jgi:penicillin-binding protein 2D
LLEEVAGSVFRAISVRRLIAALAIGPFVVAALLITAVLVTPIPRPDNPETSELLDAAGNRMTQLFSENRVIVPVTEMPDHLLNAIVAVEDNRFYTHKGLDFIGIGRAALRNLTAGEIKEGGSTLTQQLAWNLYLTHERTLTRKLKEAALAIKLEYTYSKEEILGLYWNTIYLGRGAHGAEVAAQTYFGKSVRDLTLAESALMAALPQAPEYYSLPENYDDWQDRRDIVLEKMAAQGYITAADASSAKARLLQVADAPTGAGGGGTEPSFFVNLVMQELQAKYPQVAGDLQNGGYRVTTSLDTAMQRQAENAVQTQLRADPDGHKPQVALVALDPTTGYVKALVGGAEVNMNRALEPQQPGSAFKPFVYAAALETRKYTALSTQVDAPAEFPGATAGEPWRPQNAHGRYSYQPAAMREALRKSLNVVTAQWTNTLKPDCVIALARRMGVDSPLASNLTIGLGSSAVTPLELTRAYAPFANGGTAVKPLVIVRIEDRDGNVIAEERPVLKEAISPGVAFLVTDMLKDVLGPGGTASGVAGYLGGRPAAGKTGTSDEGRDAWFVGYTPDLVAGVWVGDDDNRPSRREGASAAAPIWAKFMSGALAGRKFRNWNPPGDVVSVDVCRVTGLLPNPTCPLEREWFLTGTAPATVDPTVHADRVTPEMQATPSGTGATAPPPPDQKPAPTPPTPARSLNLQDLLQLFR